MKIRLKTLVMVLFFISVSGNAISNDTNRITVEGERLSYPVLMLVDIPSPGLLKKESGKAFLLQDDSGKYIEIDQSVVINFDNVLQLDKGSSVNINFDDGSYFSLGPVSETKWYKFKKSTRGQP